MKTLKLATRAGKLALVQANHVKDLLAEQGVQAEIIKVTTKGDADRKSSLRAIGGDGLFVRGIEQVLLAGEADIAVHSSKDLPYELADGLVIGGVPKAAAAEGLLLIPKDRPLEAVRAAGRKPVIGTGSARRRYYCEKLDADVIFEEIRGNITTRIEKLRRGDTKTYAFYESPKRIMDLVDFFLESNADIRLCLCNDMTKLHEMSFRGTPAEVKEQLLAKGNYEKGEYAVILEVNDSYLFRKEEHTVSAEAMLVDAMITGNLSNTKDAIAAVLADENNSYSKNELKTAALSLKKLFS